jgi:DNA-binding SARP family transcriptional activator/WD40 repeat protein
VAVLVLGTPTVEVDGRDVAAPELRARQARILLTLLVLGGRDGVERNALADAVWTTGRPRTWETALSALVSRLRSMFARIGVGGDVLTFGAGVYRFAAPREVVVDVDDAIDASTRARQAFEHGDIDEANTLANAAIDCFRGPLLVGEESELVARVRQRVENVQRDACTVLADAAIAQGRWTDAIEVSRRLVAMQPREEANHRRLMRALVGAGDRAEAMRAYARCREALERELGIAPSAATEALYREMGGTSSINDIASDAHVDGRRRSVVNAALVLLLVLALVTSAYAVRERDRARGSARDARAHSLSVESVSRRSTSADLALLLARQANELRDIPETRSALLSALEEPPGLAAFMRAGAPVTAIAASATAKTVVTGHSNGNLMFWSATRPERPVRNVSTNGGPVRALARDAHDARVVSGTDDGLVRQWNARTGRPLGDAITYRSPINNVPVGIAALAYAGERLVVVGRDDTMRTYSASGQPLAAEVMRASSSASGDGGLLHALDRSGTVLAQPGNGGIELWDLRSTSQGRRGSFALAPGSLLTALTVAPAGNLVATGAGNVLELWDTATFGQLGTPITLDGTVSSLAFAADGRTLAVGLAGGDVHLVDVVRHAVVPPTLTGATERVTALAFDASGARVYVGRATGATMVYGLGELTLVRRLPRYDGTGHSVAFGRRGLVVGAGSGAATIWSTAGPGPVRTVAAKHADLVVARPGTGEIAVATGGRVVLADAVSPNGREIVALPPRAGAVVALAFDRAGKTLAIATSEGGVAVLGADERFAAVPARLGVQITALAFTRSAELWIADRDGVRSYGPDGRAMRSLTDARVRGAAAIAADPSNRRLAVGTPDGVLFARLDDLAITGPFVGDHGAVRGVAYSADGSLLAAAFDDGTVTVWDGRDLVPLGGPLPINGASALSFAPDGRAVAVLGTDGNAAVITTDAEVWRRAACSIAGRQLTRTEWKTFLPGARYEPAC